MKRAVVLGLMGQYPLGGMAWQVLHHVLGLQRLGLECYYIENSGAPPYSPRLQSIARSADENLRFLAETFSRYDLADRWAYYDCLTEAWHGLSKDRSSDLLENADVILNLCGATRPEPGAARKGCLVYVETDPVFEQIKLAAGDPATWSFIRSHDVLFTYGVRIGEPDCPIPDAGVQWHKTHPPVIPELWHAPPPPGPAPWRTISTYRNRGKDFVLRGRTYHWSKHPNYERIIDLPLRTEETIEVALVTGGDTVIEEKFSRMGWKLVEPVRISADSESYRLFIQGSCGEFSVEKEDYTELKTGWFSDRSVCFLAAGRPCVVQDTGIGAAVPAGNGLLLWNTPDEALECLKRVRRDYARHCRAARDLAQEYFDAERQLRRMLAVSGV